MIVGGAGTLEVAPGIRLHTTDQIPPEYRPLAEAHAAAFEIYRSAHEGLNWTYLTPPPEFEPGERTGNYRTGDGGYLLAQTGEVACPTQTWPSPSRTRSSEALTQLNKSRSPTDKPKHDNRNAHDRTWPHAA